MSSAPQNAPGNPCGPDFTDRDIKLGKVVGFCVAMALFVVAVMYGLRFMEQHYIDKADQADQAVSPYARDTRIVPPAPQLLVDEPASWATELKRQEALITGYAWVDKQAGTVQIPVSRAIELVAEQGLPAREVAPEQ